MKRRKNNKKKRKLNMANRAGVEAPDQITHHTSPPPPSPSQSMPTRKTAIEYGRRENWIFRLSKPHRSPSELSRAFWLPFFVESSNCVFALRPRWSFSPSTEIPDVCLGENQKWKAARSRWFKSDLRRSTRKKRKA